jgi:hypothetical protein
MLLRAVLERLGDPAVRTGHRLVGFEQDARTVQAQFVDRHGRALDVARGGPEGVIDEVERRAPHGFSRIEDVIDPAELQAMINSYTRASGGR